MVMTRIKESPSFFLDRKFRRLLIYARLGIMAMLDYYGDDGLPYQDIKEAFKLPDGSLSPNLAWLKENKYVKSKEEEIEGKSVVVYYVTEDGKEAYAEVKRWLDNLLHLSNSENKV